MCIRDSGYPDQKENWTSSVVMVYRWNLGLAMAEGRVAPGFRPRLHRPADLASAAEIVDHWIRRLIGRAMLAADRHPAGLVHERRHAEPGPSRGAARGWADRPDPG